MTNKVTVINMQGIPVDLVPLPSNTWSLQGLLPGVYTLNVNVAMSSSGILGTYETILVILEPDQQPLPPTTIINQITIPCPGNSTLVDGKCTKPTPKPCPPGTTGVPPNCEPICPAGKIVHVLKAPQELHLIVYPLKNVLKAPQELHLIVYPLKNVLKALQELHLIVYLKEETAETAEMEE
jgi:hypothetical protein